MLKTLYDKIFKREIYNIGIINEPIHNCLKENWNPKVKWCEKIKKNGVFLADPFGYLVCSEKYILAEYFDYRKPYGKIVRIKVGKDGKCGGMEDILSMPYHVSYPYVFNIENNVYVVPETGMNNELAIFQLDNENGSLERIKVIKSGIKAIDPSMVRWKGKWWILYTNKENDGLYILFSDELIGKWHEHKNMPVKKEKGLVRSAGTIFEHEGQLYRPVQDCKDKYGKRIIIKRIISLNEYEYEDEEVKIIEPIKRCEWNDGIHTISAFGDQMLIDSKKEIFVFSAITRYFKVLCGISWKEGNQ